MLAWLASLVGVSGTVVLLLGYGMAASAEAVLGVPHSALFQGPNELLDLGAVAVGTWMVSAAELLQSIHFYRDYWALISEPMQVLLLVVALLFTLWGAQTIFGLNVAGWWRGAKTKLLSTKGKGIGALLMAVAVVALSPVLMLALIAVVGALMCTVPVLGMAAGERHLTQWVIAPEKCSRPIDRDKRLARIEASKLDREKKRNDGPAVVHCIRVMRDNKEVGRGRVAFSTSSAVILFNSKTGAVHRVSIVGADIEVMAEE